MESQDHANVEGEEVWAKKILDIEHQMSVVTLTSKALKAVLSFARGRRQQTVRARKEVLGRVGGGSGRERGREGRGGREVREEEGRRLGGVGGWVGGGGEEGGAGGSK